MGALTLELIRNSRVGQPGYVPVPHVQESLPVKNEVPATPVPNDTNRKLVTARLASEKQIKFLKDLLTQLAQFKPEVARMTWEQYRQEHLNGTLTLNLASEHIEALLELLKAERNAAKAAPASAPSVQSRRQFTVPSGRYAVDTEEGHLGFYRVTRSETGFYTVIVMASDEEHTLRWSTAQAILAKIEDTGIEAALARYGREIGICGRCGRTLTDAESRAIGIGPVCRTKSR